MLKAISKAAFRVRSVDTAISTSSWPCKPP